MKVLQIETWINEFSPDELNLDKLQEYLEFIKSAQERYDSSRYSEWHHVMPRCIDKDKKYSNKGVRINGRDHFLAHRLLVDCFTNSNRRRLSFALTKMLGKVKQSITPEDYEEARKLNHEALKGNQYAKGYHHTDEARIRMSMNHRDHDTESTKIKRSNSLKGHIVSDETRSKISKTLSGRELTDKELAHVRNIWKGKHHTEETKRKMSISNSGANNGMYGKHHSEDSCRKMSESRKGNSNAKGNIWITNGIDNRIIRDISLLPDRWRRGRTIVRSKV